MTQRMMCAVLILLPDLLKACVLVRCCAEKDIQPKASTVPGISAKSTAFARSRVFGLSERRVLSTTREKVKFVIVVHVFGP